MGKSSFVDFLGPSIALEAAVWLMAVLPYGCEKAECVDGAEVYLMVVVNASPNGDGCYNVNLEERRVFI
jgi:hypothetical protein